MKITNPHGGFPQGRPIGQTPRPHSRDPTPAGPTSTNYRELVRKSLVEVTRRERSYRPIAHVLSGSYARTDFLPALAESNRGEARRDGGLKSIAFRNLHRYSLKIRHSARVLYCSLSSALFPPPASRGGENSNSRPARGRSSCESPRFADWLSSHCVRFFFLLWRLAPGAARCTRTRSRPARSRTASTSIPTLNQRATAPPFSTWDWIHFQQHPTARRESSSPLRAAKWLPGPDIHPTPPKSANSPAHA